jgi:hypothetical protein
MFAIQTTEVVNFITLASLTFTVSSNSTSGESILVSSTNVFTMLVMLYPLVFQVTDLAKYIPGTTTLLDIWWAVL